jgi:hypothetical protein
VSGGFGGSMRCAPTTVRGSTNLKSASPSSRQIALNCQLDPLALFLLVCTISAQRGRFILKPRQVQVPTIVARRL